MTCRKFYLHLILVALISVSDAAAQATAEYGAKTSVSSPPTISLPRPKAVLQTRANRLAPDKNSSTSPAMLVEANSPSNEKAEKTNRVALERKTGKDGAKLMLRSKPSHARVNVEGKFVGTTPLLLVLPPGRFRLELQGPRMEIGHTLIDLLPRESREVVVPLEVRYPRSVRIP